MGTNSDARTVEGFAEEWSRFDQSGADRAELEQLFDGYFRIFEWGALPREAEGFDLGCGTGRWAQFLAPRVGRLHCIDASARVIEIARRNLADHANCRFHVASVDHIPLADSSMDFGYSLGVLHHVPDTQAGLSACVQKLRPGAPFLIYLYYAFDNQPSWYRGVWRGSEYFRFLISRLPPSIRSWVAQGIAAAVYWPLARTASFLARQGLNVASFPLAFYRDRSFYTMRTDALDRFGTRLEQRFTRQQIHSMMIEAGLDRIHFSERPPFWCAVGRRRQA